MLISADFLSLSAIASNKKSVLEATRLLAKACEVSDIRAEGSPPFRLRARVTVTLSLGQFLEGSYALDWLSPERWRQEINFPGYHEIRWGSTGKISLSRSSPFPPLRIHELTETLRFCARLRVSKGEKVVGSSTRKRSTAVLKCVRLEAPLRPNHEFCFDADAGTLVREEVGGANEEAYEYGRYDRWGERLLPRVLKAYEDRSLVVEVQIDELGSEVNQDPSFFSASQDAVVVSGCQDPDPAQELEKSPPHYPELAKLRRITGVVSVYGVIGVNGKVENLQIVRSATPELDKATLDAIRNWRYRPARCKDTSVPEETVIDIRYSLSE